jgi:hypothetical protein
MYTEDITSAQKVFINTHHALNSTVPLINVTASPAQISVGFVLECVGVPSLIRKLLPHADLIILLLFIQVTGLQNGGSKTT